MVVCNPAGTASQARAERLRKRRSRSRSTSNPHQNGETGGSLQGNDTGMYVSFGMYLLTANESGRTCERRLPYHARDVRAIYLKLISVFGLTLQTPEWQVNDCCIPVSSVDRGRKAPTPAVDRRRHLSEVPKKVRRYDNADAQSRLGHNGL